MAPDGNGKNSPQSAGAAVSIDVVRGVLPGILSEGTFIEWQGFLRHAAYLSGQPE